MGLRCPGGGKVNLLLVPSLHFGEGERAAHREGGAAVSWTGRSQEAGVQRRSHWRARKVLPMRSSCQ
ncbi:hypothetical protein CesoFtcFv8_015382 [Champsocephalus esox]|uniref:Uncharacterized protein n=1 Tax=Champsocephalus esox TaxID=159716 RepID=A0AAN8GSV5_9TELE|nr:hypothetical protein CesoFtcFv8_015382 [Champsocephalus esox]